MKTGRPQQYQYINDKNWLYDQYIVKKMSTCQIANHIGSDPAAIRYWLNKYDIPVRDFSLSHVHNREDLVIDNREVIDGNMLGDGSLLMRNRKTGISVPSYSHSACVFEHVKYVGEFLWKGDVNRRIYKYTNSCGHKSFKFTTVNSSIFSTYYSRWYPNFVKHVPKDLVLTPVVLLHWFLGDGTCSYKTGRPKEQRRLVFCSESFSRKDNGWLLTYMTTKFGLNGTLIKNNGKGTDCRIALRQSSIDDFFSIIGPPPVASLAYRWKVMR